MKYVYINLNFKSYNPALWNYNQFNTLLLYFLLCRYKINYKVSHNTMVIIIKRYWKANKKARWSTRPDHFDPNQFETSPNPNDPFCSLLKHCILQWFLTNHIHLQIEDIAWRSHYNKNSIYWFNDVY